MQVTGEQEKGTQRSCLSTLENSSHDYLCDQQPRLERFSRSSLGLTFLSTAISSRGERLENNVAVLKNVSLGADYLEDPIAAQPTTPHLQKKHYAAC